MYDSKPTEFLYTNYYQKLPKSLQILFKQRLGEGPEAVQEKWLPALEKISKKIKDVEKADPADLENVVNSALGKKSTLRRAFPYAAAASFAAVALLYIL